VLRFLTLSTADLAAQRPTGAGIPDGATDDVHFAEALVEAVVAEFSAPGDTVLDPFAGFGTTLVVAERMGRRAAGVEVLAERARAIRRRVPSRTRVVTGDARRLAGYDLGPVALCLTSPPYMAAVDHPENPLTGYATLDGHYPTYLAELGEVFAAVGRLLLPGGHLVVNAANLSTGGTVTPLAWDLAAVIANHPGGAGQQRRLTFRGETYLHWDRPRPGVTGDYLLIFRREPAPRRGAS